MVPVAEVQVAWGNLAAGVKVYVARREGEFLCEGPCNRLDLHHGEPLEEDTESVVRIWTTREQCERYCAIQKELIDVNPTNPGIRVDECLLADVWKHLNHIVGNSLADFQVTPRIELCRFSWEGEPVVIDTLFSAYEPFN